MIIARHEEQECNTCRYYDPMEGYCSEMDTYCHGYDGEDCECWTATSALGQWGSADEGGITFDD